MYLSDTDTETLLSQCQSLEHENVKNTTNSSVLQDQTLNRN